MAGGHKVVLLVDSAGAAARPGPVRRAALRLLTYLSCRFGLARVHWAFKFFDSQGARSRPSRASAFRELGSRSWDDFAEELEARLGGRAAGAHLPGPAPRASHTRGALLETLLDYQWDRPEITSPAKPVPRGGGRRLLDAGGEAGEAEAALGGFGNAVFLLAACPHSQRELLQFVAGCGVPGQSSPPPKQAAEKLLPRRVQEMMSARSVTLYWVDTTERAQLWECPDYIGYWTVCELLHHGGGMVLPPEIFSWGFTEDGEMVPRGKDQLSQEAHFSPWISALPIEATLNCLLCNSPEYKASFPRMEGTLFLPVKGKESQEIWTISLEPLAMHQRHFQKPPRVFVKGSVAKWSVLASGSLGTDNWMLQSPEGQKSTQRLLFQQLVSRLTAEELHLVASVDPGEGWPPVTGVISPLSANAMILSVFHTMEADFQRDFLQTDVVEDPQDTAFLSDIVDSVLRQVHNSFEHLTPVPPVPEWAQQELGRTVPWSPAVMEKWFPFSNISGASSNLMESFWLLQAASANKEEPSKTESELTCCLSEFYQRKSHEESTVANQEGSRKKRGLPRTPVRQKMNAMCRSLKMLNVARLNVKAQKLHPDGSPDMAVEKGLQKPSGGRTADKLEDRGRTLRSSKLKDFKSEEELLSYIHEHYQKTVTKGEITLYSCAQNMVSTIKAFLKSKGTKELEMSCLNYVKNNFLKTSKTLRQNLRKIPDKEEKVRECQIQMFLRLELCLQCSSVLASTDEMEQGVEEMTDLLRMISLTEDSAYLSEFLEEILRLYSGSIPMTIGKLYHSLGFLIPQKLAAVLPTEFLSDDSMTQESKSPLHSVPPPSSAHRSVSGSTESDQLEELRTRSAKKRRKNMLIRHKSFAEVSQNLRQIEIPKVSKRAAKNESSHPAPAQPPLPVKDTVQEVTKVRRNLFNQEMLSPSKRSLKRGLPRSQSVSAMECLHHKLDNLKKTKSTTFQGYHKLLTKSVAETPVHKQISRRLLHKQIRGRSSDPGPNVHVVEESPVKVEDEINLRRSPRIKQLSFSRTSSGSFYSASQPKSRSVQRVHSIQQEKPDQRENSPVQSIQSPKTLLFGAVSEMTSPSEKSSAQTKRSSRSTLGSEISTAYQTPKKTYQKSPVFSKSTPRRCPRTPQSPPCSPERLQNSPEEMTPAKLAISTASLKDPSSHDCGASLTSKVTPQKGASMAREGSTPPVTKMPRTPRTGAQPTRFLPNSAWPHPEDFSPESPCSPALPAHLTVPPRSECLSPMSCSFRTPPRTATLTGSPGSQKYQEPHLPEVSQTQEPAQKLNKAGKTPEKQEAISTSPPPASPKVQCTSPVCDASQSPPSPAELDWKGPRMSPSIATSLSCPVPSTPPKIPHRVAFNPIPPPPPLKLGRRCRAASSPQQVFSECQLDPSADRGLATALTGCREHPQEESAAQSPPKRHGYLGSGFRSDWHVSSPLLIASDTEYRIVLDGTEPCDLENFEVKSGASPQEEGAGLRTTGADELPSMPDPGRPPVAPSSASASPELPSCVLCCPADRRQHQAEAQQDSLHAAEVSDSPETYEVELEMQTSGLPKLRIKKIDPGVPLEADTLGRESPALGAPRASRPSNRTEHTYLSPPCLHPSHSTPGKSGGQTYICQSCTPSHCPSSTSSPFQADVGVSWTPSPKQSGKTTPDTIKDWPRRKRAVDCSAGPFAGRAEASTDLAGASSLLELERKEPSLDLGLHKSPVLEDFELEGVCKLPDQSPPRDSAPSAEEVFSWGQFGLGSRKRLLSDKDAQYEAKRVCESSSEDSEASRHEEGSPLWTLPPCHSVGDNEVFVSGSTPSSGSVLRSCLSASGLQALTQSPLLFQGRTPSSQCKDTRDEDVDVFPSTTEESEHSPFSRTFSRKRAFRTYTRKKLIS